MIYASIKFSLWTVMVCNESTSCFIYFIGIVKSKVMLICITRVKSHFFVHAGLHYWEWQFSFIAWPNSWLWHHLISNGNNSQWLSGISSFFSFLFFYFLNIWGTIQLEPVAVFKYQMHPFSCTCACFLSLLLCVYGKFMLQKKKKVRRLVDLSF